MYIGVFFEMTLSSRSPFVRMFSLDSIGPVFHDNALVQDVVSLVGETYYTRNHQRQDVSRADRQRMCESIHRIRRTVWAQLDKTACAESFVVSLLCSCLLGIFEVRMFPCVVAGSGHPSNDADTGPSWVKPVARAGVCWFKRHALSWNVTTRLEPDTIGCAPCWFGLRVSPGWSGVCAGIKTSPCPSRG